MVGGVLLLLTLFCFVFVLLLLRWNIGEPAVW